MTGRATYWRRRLVALLALGGVAAGLWVAITQLSPGSDVGARVGDGPSAPHVERLVIHSASLHRNVPVEVLVPAGSTRGRSLLVDLHGKGRGTPRAQDFYGAPALSRLGRRAPVVVLAADDGDSYWHDRSTGAWGTYLQRDVIAQARRHYGLSKRLALSGLSMGGSGVLAYALSHPGEVCAAVAASPAIWTSGGVSAAGAYDSADDYASTNPFALLATDPQALARVPTWIDIGDADPFLDAARTFAQRARTTAPNLRFTERPGGHNGGFWRPGYQRYLPWLATRLDRCAA